MKQSVFGSWNITVIRDHVKTNHHRKVTASAVTGGGGRSRPRGHFPIKKPTWLDFTLATSDGPITVAQSTKSGNNPYKLIHPTITHTLFSRIGSPLGTLYRFIFHSRNHLDIRVWNQIFFTIRNESGADYDIFLQCIATYSSTKFKRKSKQPNSKEK